MSDGKRQKLDGVTAVMKGLELDEDRFVALLTKLIGESEKLQNNPPRLVPKEDLAIGHVLDELRPFSEAEGGPLKLDHVTYVEGRGNLIMTYPGKTDKTVAFVGSHMDVVPADPSGWDHDPFKLERDGDKLYGRGTTDCLGHVAMMAQFFRALAEKKPELDVSVVAVLIASEEAGSVGTPVPGAAAGGLHANGANAGVEGLVADGRLKHLKGGPVIWVDSADSQPCIGTAGAMQWHLKFTGKLFHSGLPHKGINPIEMGSEALKIIQDRFYADFPPHPDEAKWNFATPSTMKPTQMECARGSINQIPPRLKISGDIRLTPFYDVKEVKAKVDGYVKDLQDNLGSIPTRGPVSKYTLPDQDGKIEIEHTPQ